MSIFVMARSGMTGAIRLATGRPEGVLLMEGGLAGTTRSFWALAVCLPVVIAIRLLGWAETGVPARAASILSRDVLVFTVSWLGFAVLSYQIAILLKRQAQWPRYMTAWNWCCVVQNLMVLAGTAPHFLGAPAIADQAVQLVAFGWALWLEWYAARLTLGVGALAAVWMVMMDESISLTLSSIGLALPGQ